MKSLKLKSSSQQQTINFGKALSNHLKKGDIVCLNGDLGSGKTTLVKGVASGLRINANKVNSPTFVIMNTYEGKLPVYHFDFYRLDNMDAFASVGYDEFIYGNGVALIEWADQLGSLLPEEGLFINLEHDKEDSRKLVLKSNGKRYGELLKAFNEGIK